MHTMCMWCIHSIYNIHVHSVYMCTVCTWCIHSTQLIHIHGVYMMYAPFTRKFPIMRSRCIWLWAVADLAETRPKARRHGVYGHG
jgi:hypothetical protein